MLFSTHFRHCAKVQLTTPCSHTRRPNNTEMHTGADHCWQCRWHAPAVRLTMYLKVPYLLTLPCNSIYLLGISVRWFYIHTLCFLSAPRFTTVQRRQAHWYTESNDVGVFVGIDICVVGVCRIAPLETVERCNTPTQVNCRQIFLTSHLCYLSLSPAL